MAKSNQCSVIIKYLELQQNFENKFDGPTIVWMQIGDFYEMYEYDPARCIEHKHKISRHRLNYVYDKQIGQLIDVALILGDMNVHRRDSNQPYSVDNPDTGGFPIGAYEGKMKTLLYLNYNIIRVDQIEEAFLHKYRSEDIFYVSKNSKPRRITEIVSRTTAIDSGLPPTITNNIASIYIEYKKGQRVFEDSIFTCGISCIDVTTGNNMVSELHAKGYNREAAIQEVTRFLLAQQPREVLINVTNLPKEYAESTDGGVYGPYARFLIELFELDRCLNFAILINKVNSEYSKLNYQGQFFNKIFFSSDALQLSGPDIGIIGSSIGPNSSQSNNSQSNNSQFNNSQSSSISFDLMKNTIYDFSKPPTPNSVNSLQQSTNLINNISISNDQSTLNNQSTSMQAGSSNITSESRSEKIKLLHSNSLIMTKLGLENMSYGRISYMLLLQYCYEHSPHLISKVKPPDTDWIDSKRHLTLTHNAIEQLNIAPQQGFNYRRNSNLHSLFDVLNNTRTRMGYRRLRDRLFNPLLDPSELNKSYEMIAEMNTALLNSISLILKGIPDIDNYYRKLTLLNIKPHELVTLYNAYVKIVNLFSIIQSSESVVLKTVLFSGEDANQFNTFLRKLYSTFDLDKLKESKIISDDGNKLMDFPNTPIRPGAIPELDEFIHSITYYEQSLKAVCDHLNSFLTRSRGAKIDYHRVSKDRSKRDKIIGIDIITTASKARTIQNSISSIDRSICGDIQIETHHSQRRITSNHIKGLINGLNNCKNQLRSKVLQVYYDMINEFSELKFYTAISDMVATIDFIQSARLTANKYKYYRPTIIQDDASDSYLHISELRHPVIERNIDKPYVTNDVQLGNGPVNGTVTQAKRGLLVYGANSTGKTTLARAVALAIVMAQSGLYTAGQLTYRVFHKIFTRIGGNDDSNKGRSSFVVEMCELRIPIGEADNRSLILGDEPCRGTERFSGIGIAAGTIKELLNRKSCFIMATHLHDMLDLPSFQPLKQELYIGHLNIQYDPDIGDLVINRKLCPGPGPTIYGIEVAKSLGFNNDFVRQAMAFRNEAIGTSNEILPTTKSRYNSKVYKDACLLCNTQSNLHTHHLIPQKDADDQGFIGSMSKDVAGNLVTLCKDCHHKIHHQDVSLKAIETISGGALILDKQS